LGILTRVFAGDLRRAPAKRVEPLLVEHPTEGRRAAGHGGEATAPGTSLDATHLTVVSRLRVEIDIVAVRRSVSARSDNQ